jgi:hypothetical protein
MKFGSKLRSASLSTWVTRREVGWGATLRCPVLVFRDSSEPTAAGGSCKTISVPFQARGDERKFPATSLIGRFWVIAEAYGIGVCYLMSIHEHLPPQARRELKEVGWTKGLELAKVARRDGQHFDCATWLHKARELPKEDFRREVERELTGKETEPSELIYFKVYKSQIPVIEQAIETAALMLGTDKSRGYCLEMICADFLAGAHLDNGDPEILLNSISRYYKFLPGEQQQAFLENLWVKAS